MLKKNNKSKETDKPIAESHNHFVIWLIAGIFIIIAVIWYLFM